MADKLSTATTGDELPTLTIEKLEKAMEILKNMPPDPLNGARQLLYAENTKDAAYEIAAAYEGRKLLLRQSNLVPLGHIVGSDGNKVVLLIGPEAKNGMSAIEES